MTSSLTADRGFYSWPAWDTAAATGAALLWRAPTQLQLPVVRVLSDGTYLTALIAPSIRGPRRERLLAAAPAGQDLSDINTVPDAFDQRGLPVIHLARVVEYDIPDRVGNGTGELIVLLSTITDPAGDDGARADELATTYRQRWEEETGNDQLKTHLRGPGRVLRSRLPDLVVQEIWAYLIVHHAISELTARASAAADLDPDSISFAQALRLIRRTATGTADIPPSGLDERFPTHLALLATLLIPARRERTCPPRGQTRPAQQLPSQETRRGAQHPPPSTGHDQPPRTPTLTPSSLINLGYVALRRRRGHRDAQAARRDAPPDARQRLLRAPTRDGLPLRVDLRIVHVLPEHH